MLAGFGRWLLERLDAPELELVIDGHPVFGIDFAASSPVDTRAFLTGLVLAGFMDDWSWRRTTMQLHRRTFGGLPLQIGGGEIMIVDAERFRLCGLGDTGAVEFDDEQLRTAAGPRGDLPRSATGPTPSPSTTRPSSGAAWGTACATTWP